jgi:hypothetical protein
MTGRGPSSGSDVGVPWLPAVPRWSPLYLARIWHGRWLVGSTCSPRALAPGWILRRISGAEGGVGIDDLARWELCGVPSTWHRPTTRRPGGTIPAYRRSCLPGVPPVRRVVALGEVGGMPHPVTLTAPGLALVSAIPEICPPGEGMLCLGRAAFADVARLRERCSGS